MEIFEKRIVYQIPGMEKVEPHRGLSFGSAAQEGLGLDVYVPPGLPAGSRVPGVLLIHGGPGRGLGKTPRSWGVFQSYGELIAASGLVALMPDHRYHSWGALEQSTGDLQAALLHARERAADFQLDPDRLAVWAFSGGGVLLTTFLRERPSHVRCLLAFYPVLDPKPFQDRAPELTDELAERFSLASGLGGDGSGALMPPLLLARAGLDNPLFNQGVDRFAEAALAANAPLELINHPQGRHGFDILDDDPRSRAILARAVDFLKTWL
jgi:acetyl esterase/lipase